MEAALYLNHHYGIPVIGWEHEIAKLTQQDALEVLRRAHRGDRSYWEAS